MNLYILKGGTYASYPGDTLWFYETEDTKAYCIHDSTELYVWQDGALGQWIYGAVLISKTTKI